MDSNQSLPEVPVLARKFLYFIAICIVLVLGAGLAWSQFSDKILQYTSVPDVAFVKQEKLAENIYDDPAMWFARPGRRASVVNWLPPGIQPAGKGDAAVFFIHPTSYLEKDHWNAPLDDSESQNRAGVFLQGMASAFNASGDIWAPRYRQAAFGAFITDKPEGQMAIDAAYQDVLQAFDAFLAGIGPDQPIVLAGHSQGSLHLTHLLKDRVAGTPLAKRVVAAYVVGWPISETTDLKALGLPQCTGADQPGCILSWLSYAEPADFSFIESAYNATTGFDGESRSGTPMVCTNPLTGTADGDAPIEANLGTLVPNGDLTEGELVPAAVPARCDAKGFLMIGDPPKLGPYVLPGNNYHVYDYPLFWANVRADIARRLAAFEAQ